MEFVEGCNFEEFGDYLHRIGQYTGQGELEKLRNRLASKANSLIVFRENGQIIGHAIWHETNTDEHRKGDPRDKVDRDILRGFFGKKRDLVELHELWLIEEHRGKGYGKLFFDYFEDYMRNKGHDAAIYYAFDPAAVAICRKRGYDEAYGVTEAGPYGKIETMYVYCMRLEKKRKPS